MPSSYSNGNINILFDMILTKNFSKSEFECKCGCEMPESTLNNVKRTALALQKLRDAIGKPIKINSGYRCLFHNRSIGSTDTSQHVLGKAADIVVAGKKPKKIIKKIEKLIENNTMPQGGLAAYETFTHYDIRGFEARWNK